MNIPKRDTGENAVAKVTRFRRTFATDICETSFSAISAHDTSSEKSGFLRRSDDLPKKLREMAGTKTFATFLDLDKLGHDQIMGGHHC